MNAVLAARGGTVLLDVASPPARRLKQATWLDPRLLGGVLLIVVSIVIGARVVAGADKTTAVYAATADLPAGHVLAAGDLKPVRVRLTSGATNYVAGGEVVVGRVVERELRGGELVASSAVVVKAVAPSRDVSVSVKPEHIPADIPEGSTVDVIATGPAPGGGSRTWTVAKGLEVVRSQKATGGFAATEARIVLKVPAGLVLSLTAAMRSSEIDVVQVPMMGAPGDIGDEAASSQTGGGGQPSAQQPSTQQPSTQQPSTSPTSP